MRHVTQLNFVCLLNGLHRPWRSKARQRRPVLLPAISDRNRRIERASRARCRLFIAAPALASAKQREARQCQGVTGCISTAELAEILDRPDLRLFDCTTYLEYQPEGSDVPYIAVPGRHTFEAGHIPGADFLDLQGEFSDSNTELRFMMPDVAQLETAFGFHGISGDSKVVLYSIGTPMWATRFWWMLTSLGSKPVGARWWHRQMELEGRAIETGPARDTSRRRSRRTKTGIFCRQARTLTATSERNTVVVNALGPKFHRGPGPAATAGPAACPAVATCRRLPARSATKAFVPLRKPKPKFKAQGITKDKRVIAYCGGGISATIDLFLLHRLGHDNLTLYDGSMGEWAKDTSLPIETVRPLSPRHCERCEAIDSRPC